MYRVKSKACLSKYKEFKILIRLSLCMYLKSYDQISQEITTHTRLDPASKLTPFDYMFSLGIHTESDILVGYIITIVISNK